MAEAWKWHEPWRNCHCESRMVFGSGPVRRWWFSIVQGLHSLHCFPSAAAYSVGGTRARTLLATLVPTPRHRTDYFQSCQQQQHLRHQFLLSRRYYWSATCYLWSLLFVAVSLVSMVYDETNRSVLVSRLRVVWRAREPVTRTSILAHGNTGLDNLSTAAQMAAGCTKFIDCVT
jgi:hypothetical protein